jgi:5-methylcytosine-specific restriction endonuclease McrA
MLKKDSNGGFIKSGFWIFSTYRFVSGCFESENSFSVNKYKNLLQNQEHEPIQLMYDEQTNKKWWIFNNEIYWENEGYDVREVKALALEKSRKKEQRLSRAISHMENEEISNEKSKREPISDDVKIFVWNRDGGQCVKCGSKNNLEYDHIIPASKGGSSTARNIQLLCEYCNRSKSDSLI